MSESVPLFRSVLRRVLRPLVTVLALAYFLIDALVYWVVRPFARWIGRLPVFGRVAGWAAGLRPYPALLLVLLPLAILEPAKPVAAWLFATGRPWPALLVLGGAELVKLTLVERLFHLTRPKLLTIPWFAWIYARAVRGLDWLKALPPWQAVRRAARRLREAGRRVAALVRGWHAGGR
ncbi:hypothetical protein [Azospirillum doebereinerae]|uniref:Uncharacterized protein n=1 Tax=Azospirillum doebereinerae TaxID=92933 RepID=A0A433J873_9PROT|nr:hypothetical protein [Azospirillum doebereinerae]MCG5241716.1 hypothetical protein [Azospirillum doebereinerae]RUQ70197.1 hypothetical protein EJ913_14460 [Azospirillum doebereinerae]